jgi:hypothetical protein
MLADERRVWRGGNGEQRGEVRGAGVFNSSLWARCVVVSTITDWAVVRRVLDGVVVSVQ